MSTEIPDDSPLERLDAGEILPDPHNANLGTKRGRQLVHESITRYGAGRSILLDRNNTAIAGNKTLEAWQERGGKVIIVETDGDELVAVRRRDLDLSEGTAARELAYVDNETQAQSYCLDHKRLQLDTRKLNLKLTPFWRPEDLTPTEPGDRHAREDAEVSQAEQQPEQTAAEDQSGELKSSFMVLITCSDEGSQTDLWERLTGEGYACRLLTQ